MKNKEKAVAFTGHRTEKLPKGEDLLPVIQMLTAEIDRAIHEGFVTFYFGGSYGFDLIAARVVLEKQWIYPYIKLIAVVPHEEQAVHYSERDHETYYDTLPKCHEVIQLNTHFHPHCHKQRNQYMVDRAQRLIAYWNGDNVSGTAQTVRMANRAGVEVVHLYPRFRVKSS